MFLGYPQRTKGYRLWVKDSRGFKTIISRGVIFNENEFSYLSNTNVSTRNKIVDTSPIDISSSLDLVKHVSCPTNQVEQREIYSTNQIIIDFTTQSDIR